MPSPEAPPRSERDAAHGVRELSVCVLEGNRLRAVQTVYDPATGDTLYGGRPFRAAFPDAVGYAGNKRWYVDNEPILWESRRYEKIGPPRVLSPDRVRVAGQHGGVVLFAEAHTAGTPDIIYVPTKPGCEFHQYHWDARTGPIRGR